MTPEQIERVEKMVNEAIAADMPVVKQTKSLDEAKMEGAMALFGEKYGETVRTITIMESDSLLSTDASIHSRAPSSNPNTLTNCAVARISTAPPILGIPHRQRKLCRGRCSSYRSGDRSRRV